ncbi:MAG: metallophosphoesterase [Verrucomicrobiota bacterium]
MKILSVSDLHYSLKQFDWLVRNASRYELIVIAGDLMELGSYVDSDTQAAVLEQYFRKICKETPMVVCSGNHDLVDEGDGTRTSEWLEDLAVTGLHVDLQCLEVPGLRMLALPWWESPEERGRVADWLAEMAKSREEKVEIWVNHAPPKGTKTSWSGKRDLGDPTLVDWIETYQPNLVLTGHVHNAPYYPPEGAWIDRLGGTVITNSGRQTGEAPATIEIETDGKRLRWCGMEGCEDDSFAS